MLAEIAEYIRAQGAALPLSAAFDLSYVAPGDGWARDNCRMWIVHYEATHRPSLGPGPGTAVAGLGVAGPSASAPVFDLMATFVANCYPTPLELDQAPDPVAINDWSADYLADVEDLGQMLAALDLTSVGVTGGKLTIGPSTSVGPQAGVARVSWPLSVNGY